MVSDVNRRWVTVFAIALVVLGAMGPAASAQTVLTSCGTLATGNYVLGSNITTSGDCFVITGDHVAIDFKGKSLTGDGTGSGITDGGSVRQFAVISNGEISNFANGINLSVSGSAAINQMNVSKNSNFGVRIHQCCNTVNSVKAIKNGNDGIHIDLCCNTISKSQALNNGGAGIAASAKDAGDVTTISDSTASNNAGDGIDSLGCCSFAVRDQVSGNGGQGIHMDECCNGVINSTVTNNGGDGVELLSDDNIVVSSKSNKNGGAGFNLSDNTKNQVTSSQANGNTGAGVDIDCPSIVALLNAKNNSGGNLVTSGGTCTQFNNKAP